MYLEEISANRCRVSTGWNPNCRRTLPIITLSGAIVSQLQFRDTRHIISGMSTMIIQKPLEHMATDMHCGQVGNLIFTTPYSRHSMAPKHSRCTHMPWQRLLETSICNPNSKFQSFTTFELFQR